MKILFLNQAFYPDVVSSAQHLADLARALAERGHDVTVLTGRRAYDDPQVRFEPQEHWHGVRILRVSSTAFGKSARWRRAFDALSFLLLACARACTLPRGDVVVALTSPPIIGLLGLALARWHQSRFIEWILDLNPDQAIAAGWLRRDSFCARFLARLSQFTLRGADQVIVLDRFMGERVLAKGVLPKRVTILPPWSHLPEVRFDPVGRRRFRAEHNLDNKFVVMYSGNHSPCHPLDTVLQAAARLACNPEIVFCFIGGGSEFRKIQQSLRAVPDASVQPNPPVPPNILCLPYQPRSQLSASLSAADLHLVLMGDAFVGVVHPCKIYNILTVGSPVLYIGPTPSPVSETLHQAAPQVLRAKIRHGDVAGFLAQIQRIRNLSLPHSTQRTIPNVEHFSPHTILPQLITLLESFGPAPAQTVAIVPRPLYSPGRLL